MEDMDLQIEVNELIISALRKRRAEIVELNFRISELEEIVMDLAELVHRGQDSAETT